MYQNTIKITLKVLVFWYLCVQDVIKIYLEYIKKTVFYSIHNIW